MLDAGESPLADVHPNWVHPDDVETAEIRAALDSTDPLVVGAGFTALSAVARDDPSVVAVDDALLDCLRHESRVCEPGPSRYSGISVPIRSFPPSDRWLPTTRTKLSLNTR